MSEEHTTIDGDGVVIEHGPQPLETKPMSMTVQDKVDIDGRTNDDLAIMRTRVRNAREMTALALQLASPNQFVVHSGKDGKATVYATGGAADRILRQGFGMRWRNIKVRIQRTIEDGSETTTAVATGELLDHRGELYEEREGRRTLEGYVNDENDLHKAVVENMKARAVSDIMGFRFMSPEDFRALGMDLSKMTHVHYQDHTDEKGSDEISFRFGNEKGVALSQIKDLAYYKRALEKSIADPERSKWKAKNEQQLKALEAEMARRSGPAPGTDPVVDVEATIEKCQTKAEMEAVWKGLSALSLTDEQLAHVKARYKAHFEKLAEAASKKKPKGKKAEDPYAHIGPPPMDEPEE